MINYFFDVPIYRVSEARYRSWLEHGLSAVREYVAELWGAMGKAPPRDNVLMLEEHHMSGVGGWRFNEIIGYVRLHFMGDQVRGEHFSAETTRTQIGKRKKVFRMVGWKLAPEMQVPHGASNEDVFKIITTYVERCRAELRPGRVFDTALLEEVGPFIDWNGLRKSQRQPPSSPGV